MDSPFTYSISAALKISRRLRKCAVLTPGLLLALASGPAARAQAPAAARTRLPEEIVLKTLASRPPLSQAAQVLRQELALTPADNLQLLRTETDELGLVHQRYQQYYQGVKVEHGVMSVHARAGRLESLSGELRRSAAMPSVSPALSENAALQQALQTVGARQYKWQLPGEERALKAVTHNPRASYAPKGELVLVGDFNRPAASRPLVLAWKFNIYAQQPVSREYIYVNAHTGQVVLRDAIIKHLNVTGTGATKYLGTRPIYADQFGGGYRLRESVHGKGVVTLNAQRSNSYAAAVDFVDNDNNWSAAEYNNANFDNAALDAHVGAQVNQDYWTNVHGRDSFDDKGTVLTSYVHYDDTPGDGVGYQNAYWNGAVMTYGDGASRFRPLTSLDVCAHEIGHAICETTANLVYQSESGALNEGFSDIWGAAVEHHLDPSKQTWLIGEDIDKVRPSLRSMSNPNAESQPDTYQGTYWAPTANPSSSNDYGGVHTNSGVLNYWFYLLSVGGSGTNDHAKPYSVTGITIGKAARIAYRAERLYLTPNATYSNARQATLQAAVDLFGLGSAEVTAVAKAWQAVGVERTEAAPTITSFSPTSGLVGQSVTLTGTNFGSAYRVTFNGTDAVAATYTSLTSLTVKVPAGATTGPITLTTATGSVTTGTSFTVQSPGAGPAISSYAPAGGAVQGTTVTITGTNFTGATAVSFAGVAASYMVVNATTISATIPAGASTGALSVATPTGTASINFTVLPAITSFSPTSGGAGTSVTIIGSNLANARDVKFNGMYVDNFTVVNSTTITTQVPAGATTGPLTVRTPDGTATGPANFTVNASLLLSSFSPARGPVGTVVTLLGDGFTGATAVKVNGTAVSGFTVASDTEIWATVAAGTRSGFIAVTTPQGTVSSARMYEVTVASGAPVISSFTPASGAAGTVVTISGTNLNTATAVTFNGTPASAFNVYTVRVMGTNHIRIDATVAPGTTSGPITVANTVATALSSKDFYITPANDLCANAITVSCGSATTGTTHGSTATGDPTTSCGPTTGGGQADLSASPPGVFYKFVGIGGNVTVTTCANASFDSQVAVYTGSCGTFTCVTSNDDGCGGGSGSILTFNSVLNTTYYIFVTGWYTSAAQPGTGDFTLSVNCASVPSITSFTPGSGPAGTSVALTGTNFSGATAVRFNGVATPFTLNSATSISTAVPAGAATGPITVLTPLGTAVSPAFFTVTTGAALSSFSPAAGLAGTVVTLTGTNFSGATAVRFNGTDAASYTVNSATEITAVVPGAGSTGTISVVTPGGTATSASPFEVLTVFNATYNQCLSTTAVASTGSGTWQLLKAANGQVVAAINDQGFALGQVTAEFTLHQGGVRSDAMGRDYLNRNWHLNAQNTFAGRTVQVRFYAPHSEFADYVAANDNDASDATALNQLRLTQYQGPNEDCLFANNSGTDYRLLPAAELQAVSGASWFVLEAAVADHFSEFYANGGTQPLPVELVEFSAKREHGRVLTQWRTAQEVNNRGFVVERSADGKTFRPVSALLPGAGYSTAPRAYAFTDAEAPAGLCYYRLRQQDESGQSSVSPVVALAASSPANALSCYPQPARTGTTVKGALPGTAVTLFDTLGRSLAAATAGPDGSCELRLPTGLAAGVYVVRSGAHTTRLTVE